MKYKSLYRNLVKVPVGVTFDEVRSYFNYIVNLANRIIDIYFANNIKLSESNFKGDFEEVYNYYCEDGHYCYCDDDDYNRCEDFFGGLYFFENYVSYVNNVNNEICDKVSAKEEAFEFLFDEICPVDKDFARDLFNFFENDIDDFLDEIFEERKNTPETKTINKPSYLEIGHHPPMDFLLHPDRGFVFKTDTTTVYTYFDIGEENIKKIEKDNFTYVGNFLHSIEELMNRIIDIYIINDIRLPEENLLSDFWVAYNYYYYDIENDFCNDDNYFDDNALICHWKGQFLEKEIDYIHGIDISALKKEFCTYDLRFFYRKKIEDCIMGVIEDRKQMGETPKEVETRIKQFI